MDSDKLFNLQLTIQKLEVWLQTWSPHFYLTLLPQQEELTLYRNGTTSSDLIEIISEKDEEISSLKTLLNEKNEMLAKFHRGTIEVLKQNETLTKTIEEKTVAAENAMKEIEILNELFSNLKHQTDEKISNLEKLISEQDFEIKDLNETVVRLQQQCANVVKDKQELHKNYELDKEDWEEMKEKYEVFSVLLPLDVASRLSPHLTSLPLSPAPCRVVS
jgi:DNA repair exonuclease SbcCD ATPase subunit